MSLSIQPAVLDYHALRVANVFSNERGYDNEDLIKFFVWLDGLIVKNAKSQKEDGVISENAQARVFHAIGSYNRTIGEKVALMNGMDKIPGDAWAHPGEEVLHVIEHAFKVLPESEVLLALDGIYKLVRYAEYEDKERYSRVDANSRINTAEMLFDKIIDSGYIKSQRDDIPVGCAE